MTISARWFATLFFTVSLTAYAAAQMPMVDGDADGVNDERDECPYTEPGIRVNKLGCPLLANDGDADGVADARDSCPYSPAGGKVDAKGCAIDTDFDGVANGLDACPSSAIGVRVGDNGCTEGEVAEVRIPSSTAAAALDMEVVKPARPSRKDRAKAKADAEAEALSAETVPAAASAETPVIAAAETPAKRSKSARKPKRQPSTEAAPAPEVVRPTVSEPVPVIAEAKPLAEPGRRGKSKASAAKDSEVRPPSDSDRIKAEKPSKAYLAARAAAEGNGEAAVVEAPKATPPSEASTAPTSAAEAQPAAGSQINALLDSLNEEGSKAVPAGKTPEQMARDSGEKPEKAELTLHFAASSTEIAGSALTQLRGLANALKLLMDRDPALTLTLTAYAGKGEAASVVERRLALVRALLTGREIPANRIAQSVGRGGPGRVLVSSSH